MRDLFFGYYPPTQEEYERLWKEAVIVLDTNVLLDLYRLPKDARDEFFDVLEALKDRLWLPYQVALEFQRRRLTVIAAERKGTESALEFASALVEQVTDKVNSLQIEKHALGIDPKPLLDDLHSANTKVIEAIKAVHGSQLDIAATDPVRERLDAIIGDRIGKAPATSADLDALIESGEERYSAKIPPGFSDIAKEKNPSEAELVHDGLIYQRKFGDLILWRQLIAQAQANSLKNVLFITSDKKEDWWWREQGKTIGPHPELIREIQRVAKVELFWMYSSVQFLEHAGKQTRTKVSDKSVADLQGLLSAHKMQLYADSSALSQDVSDRRDFVNYEEIDSAVRRWLEESHERIVPSEGFPDFISISGDELHGFEVKYVPDFQKWSFPRSVTNSMLLGQIQMLKGKLDGFTLVAVISQRDYLSILKRASLDGLHERLGRLLKKHPVSGIVMGMVNQDGNFQPLAHVTK